MEYKTAFLDTASVLQGPKYGMKSVSGVEMARLAEATLNEKYFEGYEYVKHIEINSNPHMLVEGYLLIFRKIEK